MIRFIFYSIIFFQYSIIKSQVQTDLRVVDTENNGVAYGHFYIQDKMIGGITDSLGYFKLPINQLSIKKDTLIFSSIGYRTQKIPYNNLIQSDTKIILPRETFKITEVTVTPKENKLVSYGYFDTKNSIAKYSSRPGNCILVYIDNPDIDKSGIIKKIQVKVYGSDSSNCSLRLHFFEKINDQFKLVSNFDKPIIITDYSSTNIEIDVRRFKIPFDKKGVYLGFEWLTAKNEIVNMNKMYSPMIGFTRKRYMDNTTFLYRRLTDDYVDYKIFTDEIKNNTPLILRRYLTKLTPQIGIEVRY